VQQTLHLLGTKPKISPLDSTPVEADPTGGKPHSSLDVWQFLKRAAFHASFHYDCSDQSLQLSEI